MLIAALVFAGLAALVHVYIWFLESIRFMTVGRKVFGLRESEAAVVRPWAFNQGFYNLFLAIGVGVGIAMIDAHRSAGMALVVFGTAAMAAAALVLLGTDRTQVRGVLVQGTFPALTLLALLAYAVR